MIELTKYERELINICKGRRGELDPENKLTVIELFAAFYMKHYALDPNEYPEWRSVIFNKLFNTYMKIRDWKGSTNQDIIEIFTSSFSKGYVRYQDEPVERAMAELYGAIQCTTVIEKGVKRFELEYETNA